MVLVVAAGVEDEESDVERTKRGDGQLLVNARIHCFFASLIPSLSPG